MKNMRKKNIVFILNFHENLSMNIQRVFSLGSHHEAITGLDIALTLSLLWQFLPCADNRCGLLITFANRLDADQN